MDWEEFLTVSGNLLGAFISIDKADPDGTSFNQLRDATKDMEVFLPDLYIVSC